MVSNVITSIHSLRSHISLRDVLGVKVSNTFLLYKALNTYLDYCRSMGNVRYNTYATSLLKKIDQLHRECPNIKKAKYKDVEGIQVHNISIERPLGDIYLSFQDLLLGYEGNLNIDLITVETMDYTYNDRREFTIEPTDTLLLKPIYTYLRYDENTIVEVSKLIYDSYTASGFTPFDVVDNKLVMLRGSERATLQISIYNNVPPSLLKIRLLSHQGATRYISDSSTIEIRHHLDDIISQEYNSAVNIEVPQIGLSKPSEDRVVDFSISGVHLDIPNFYDITFKSRFLEVSSNFKVTLSKSYRYELNEGEVIAIPIYVYDYLNRGYEVEDINSNMITISKVLEDGNKESLSFHTFSIKDSLYLKYRTKESGKLPSDEISIRFKFILPKDRYKTQDTEITL